MARIPHAGALRRPPGSTVPESPRPATLFGEPVGQPWWYDDQALLPAVGRQVGEAIGALTFLAEASTKSNLREVLPRVDLLHLEQPVFVRKTPVRLPRLQVHFSPDALDNAPLTERELADLDLSGSRLATVTPPWSWNVMRLAEEGHSAFAMAFLRGGTGAVLTRLWRTDPETETRFLTAFYREFRNDKPAAQALRETQLAYLRGDQPMESPAAWAAYALYGPPEGEMSGSRLQTPEPVQSAPQSQQTTGRQNPSSRLAEESKEILRIRSLSAAANQTEEKGSPYLAILLAAEGVRRAGDASLPAPEALTTLRSALSLTSGRALPRRRTGRLILEPSRSLPASGIPLDRSAAPGQVRAMEFSGDGRCLAVGAWDGTLDLWRYSDQIDWFREVGSWLLPVGVSSLAVRDDCHWLAVLGRDGNVRLADLTQGAASRFVELASDHSSLNGDLRFSADGRSLLAAMGPIVVDWQIEPEVKRQRLYGRHEPNPLSSFLEARAELLSQTLDSKPGEQRPEIYAVHPTRRLLALPTPEGSIRLMSASTSTLSKPAYLPGHSLAVTALEFSPSGASLASAGGEKNVRLWNLQRTEPAEWVRPAFVADGLTTSFAFSPSGHWLAAGTHDGSVRLWRRSRPQDSEPLVIDDGTPIQMGKLVLDGSGLLTYDTNGRFRLWDLRSPNQPKSQLLDHDPGEFAVSFKVTSSDDSTWWAIPKFESLQLWKVSTPASAKRVLDLVGVERHALHGQGHWLATLDGASTVRVYDLRETPSGSSPPMMIATSGSPPSLAFHPSGDLLVGSSFWDLEQGASIELQSSPGPLVLKDATFSPDGRWLVADGEEDGTYLYQFEPPNSLRDPLRIEQPKYLHGPSVFSGDSLWLAVDGTDHRHARFLRLRARGAEEVQILPRETALAVLQILIPSPDGRWLGSMGLGAQPFLWDMDEPYPALTATRIPGHQIMPRLNPEMEPDLGTVFPDLSFSPDGRRMATVDLEGAVRVWRLEVAELIEAACRIAGRNLSIDDWQKWVQPPAPYRCTCPQLPPGLGGPNSCPVQ